MPEKPLRTSDVARRCGISVNTVRLYEQLGYLPPVPRAPNGYRLFAEHHVQHVKLARQAMRCTWIGGVIRRTALDVLLAAAQGDYSGGRSRAEELVNLLKMEQRQAEEAIRVLERWVEQPPEGEPDVPLRIGDAARRLRVTIDELRSWERNGLLTVSRAANGYRLYGCEEIDRLLVIRALRRARYSTMSILRMLQYLDEGQTDHLREVLDTPPPDADIEQYPTDSWLSTLHVARSAAESMCIILEEL